jgi:hypothetical protein
MRESATTSTTKALSYYRNLLLKSNQWPIYEDSNGRLRCRACGGQGVYQSTTVFHRQGCPFIVAESEVK